METFKAMTADSVAEILSGAGAEVLIRSGWSENYGAPRECSFEVKSIFPNGLALQVVARQYNYRDSWEAKGRVNDLVDATLTRNGALSPLPKGFPWFQGVEEECNLDQERLKELIDCVRSVNPKLYLLQEMTGDL